METTSEVPHILQKNEKFVTCTLEGPQNTSTCTSAASLSSLYVDNSFDIDEFKKNVQIEVKELCDERVVFELININVAFANALRRILIAEVPTIAIETVHLWQNTGVIQDEVLAHRLGLIPLKIDPDSLIYKHGTINY
jgi:DNA-directed RNA polymerases I and III subunit RPAC1